MAANGRTADCDQRKSPLLSPSTLQGVMVALQKQMLQCVVRDLLIFPVSVQILKTAYSKVFINLFNSKGLLLLIIIIITNQRM